MSTASTAPSRRSRLRSFQEAVSTRLWPLPTAGLVLALLLGLWLPTVEVAADGASAPPLGSYLFGGGPSAARTLLGTIAGALITVTSLTFSLTVVTLQLASSQYSPRLLRTFTSDRFVHVVLALFVGSFVYTLTVLRTVRTADDSGGLFVPRVAVTVAFALVLASALGLVLFLAHLAREIRVETILRNVHAETTATFERELAERGDGAAPAPAALPDPPGAASHRLVAARSGFLVGVDPHALLAACDRLDAVVRLDRCVGDTVVRGSIVGRAWHRSRSPLAPAAAAELDDVCEAALSIGVERTAVQDLGFGLRQLTDVAIRALSPSVNDPTTAVHALNHAAALLCDLAGRATGPLLLLDDDEVPRVALARPTFADLLDVSLAQSRTYGTSDPLVAAALLDLLSEVAGRVDDPGDAAAVRAQLDHLDEAIGRERFDPGWRHRLEERATEVRRQL